MDYLNDLDFLFEADDDGGTNGAPTPTTDADGTPQVNTGDNNTDADTGNDNQDQNDDGIQDPTENQDNNQDDDFTIETPDTNDDQNANDNNTEDTGEDTTTSTSSGGDEEKPEVDSDSPKANDKNLYDSLSPAEQEMKNKKLKEQFIELYSTFETYIKKFNDMVLEFEDMAPQIKHTVDMMFSAKKMISDWLLHVFDSKSYIENDIMYNRYLQVLNSVKNITEDMKKAYKDEIQEV